MILRQSKAEDKAAVISVLSESFDGWHGEYNDAYWLWKFDRNPHGPAQIWVAQDGDRLAGCYVLNPVTLDVGGTPIQGAQAVDAAVGSDYRGRGVFTDLARAALTHAAGEGIGLAFAFPVKNALGGQLRIGFKPQFAIPKVHRPLLLPARRPKGEGFTLAEVDAFDPRFDVFAERPSASEVAVRRDAGYLQWRYCEHPTRRYEVLTCERDGELYGYCVLELGSPRDRLPRGFVLDLQVSQQSRSAAGFLVYEALKRLRSRGTRVAMTWARPGGPEQEALRSYGFSSRYAAMRRRLTRPPYVEQFILFELEGPTRTASQPSELARDRLRWSLVPGDLDEI